MYSRISFMYNQKLHLFYIAVFLCKSFIIVFRVKYTDSPCGFTKFWIWSIAFQKYIGGPRDLHLVTHIVPNFCRKYMHGPCGLHFVTHLVPNLDLLKPLYLLAGD
ncbi:hypothetical protein Hanom_Chr04g00305311 [Helianthus anomalus]